MLFLAFTLESAFSLSLVHIICDIYNNGYVYMILNK
jgi:hypothetical protein